MGYKPPRDISLYVGSASMNPADSTTYYFGDNVGYGWGNQGWAICYIPVTGMIRMAQVTMTSTTATGTNESIVMVIRKNNTTDYTFATVGAATAVRLFANYALAIPVSQGDYIEFKVSTPAWVTNPEGCRCHGKIVLEYE